MVVYHHHSKLNSSTWLRSGARVKLVTCLSGGERDLLEEMIGVENSKKSNYVLSIKIIYNLTLILQVK